MIEPISKIGDLKKFKQEIFSGKIFLFKKNSISADLITQIKNSISKSYKGSLDNFHHIKNHEELSVILINELKNQKNFKDLFKLFLTEVGFNQGKSYWDKFVVRIAPASNNFKPRENSRIGIHRDTWGTNIHQQVNWWAPINDLDVHNTLIFYPDYFSKKVRNSTSSWDLNVYLEKRKKNDFSYPSAPEILEDLPSDVKILPITIEPGQILCFSGSHLHSSSKENSLKTRFSYEIRSVCLDDIYRRVQAKNIDCDLKWQFPKIFRHIETNSQLEITS